MSSDEGGKRAYSPPELTEYGKVEQLTEQSYRGGQPDDFPGGGSPGDGGFPGNGNGIPWF